MAADELLFPGLEKKKTWLMVKKDLERAEIPYETAEGIADFHAAGRHTHVTELLRSGASFPEARQLARHSDVIDAWPRLPTHIKASIEHLCRNPS
jgi:hypothetical protein